MGAEKVAITRVNAAVAAPTHKLSASDVAAECDGLVSPQDIFVVKGWSRGISLLTILMAASECPEFHEAPQGECGIFSEYMWQCFGFFVTESEALPADIKENLSSTIRVTVRSFFLPGNLMVIRHSEI